MKGRKKEKGKRQSNTHKLTHIHEKPLQKLGGRVYLFSEREQQSELNMSFFIESELQTDQQVYLFSESELQSEL